MRKLFLLLLLIFVSMTITPTCAVAQTHTVTYMSTWSSTAAYNVNEIVLMNGVNYISLVAANLNHPPVSSPAYWDELGNDTSISVKRFGAIGNGMADDTAALNRALTYMTSNGGCLYFPRGAYKTTSALEWNSYATLCLHGENATASYIEYLGAATVDAGFLVQNTSGFSAVDIRDIGFAANANASYAFHAVTVGGPSPMSNVAFDGGSVSAFEGDFWNGEADLRNLIAGGPFRPSGIPACVNGLSFSGGLLGGTAYPSNQFTLTEPTVEFCTGIGLNMAQAAAVVVNGGQISSNHQQLYVGCSLGGCNALGNVFNDVLLEDGGAGSPAASVVSGSYNKFVGLMGPSLLSVTGSTNDFELSQLLVHVAAGASFNSFENNWLSKSSTDSGTDSFGSGNTAQGSGSATILNSPDARRTKVIRLALCTTAAAVGAYCDTTLTWPVTFQDNNYSLACSQDGGPGPGVLSYWGGGAGGRNVRITAVTAAGAGGTASCIALHN